MSDTAPLSPPLPNGDINDCYSGINSDPCHDEPDVTSAKDACEKINKKSKQLWEDMVPNGDFLDPISASSKCIDSIGKAFGSSSDSESTVIQSVKEQNNSVQVQQLFNQCDAYATSSAENIITGQSDECVEALAASGFKADEIRTTINNIKQNAKASATAGCSVQSMMQNVASLKTSTDQQAVLQVLQEANGLFSGNSANTNFCSSIDVTNDTCSWMQQQNCCIANANAEAMNLIDAGCLTDQANITQNAVSNASSTCSISSSGSNSLDMSNYIAQKADADVSQKSTGVTSTALIILIVIIFAAPTIVLIIASLSAAFGSSIKSVGTAISEAARGGDKVGGTTNSAPKPPPSNKKQSNYPSVRKKTSTSDASGVQYNIGKAGGAGVDWTGLIVFLFSLAISAGCCFFLAALCIGYYNSTKVDAIDGMLNYPLTDCDSTALSTMGDFAENLANPFNWPNLVPDLGIGDNAYVGTRSTYEDAVATFESNDKVYAMDFFVDRDKVATPTASPEGVVYEDPTGADNENPISGDNPPKDKQMGTVMYVNTPTYEPQSCTKIGGMNEDKFTTFTKAKATTGWKIWRNTGIGAIVFGIVVLAILILFIVFAAKSGSGANITINNDGGSKKK